MDTFKELGEEGEVWSVELTKSPLFLGTSSGPCQSYSRALQDQAHLNVRVLHPSFRFGESSAKKMVSWTRTHLPPTSSTPPTVLDLGCGNGHFLFLLSSKTNGYPGKLLTGVDYSQGSVDLAQMIGQAKASGEGKEDSDESESEDEDEGAEDRVGTEGEVQFEQADVLLGEELKGGPWDLV